MITIGKLYFYYGVVNSGKTAFALMKRFEFEQNNKKVILFRPALDKTKKDSFIRSRVGLEYECIKIFPTEKISDKLKSIPDVVIVDEIQFLSQENILELRNLNCTVFCFGLKTDYKGNLFQGSKVLLAIADTIREIPTSCQKCTTKAIISHKTSSNSYTPLCYNCWKNTNTSRIDNNGFFSLSWDSIDSFDYNS